MLRDAMDKDYTRFSGLFLQVLGWINVACLNLGGLILVWIGARIRRYRSGFRLFYIWLSGLSIIVMFLMLAYVAIHGTAGTVLHVFGHRIPTPPLWSVFLVGVAFIATYGIPLVALMLPGTRQAFVNAREKPSTNRSAVTDPTGAGSTR
jgi:hypothetical protein